MISNKISLNLFEGDFSNYKNFVRLQYEINELNMTDLENLGL